MESLIAGGWGLPQPLTLHSQSVNLTKAQRPAGMLRDRRGRQAVNCTWRCLMSKNRITPRKRVGVASASSETSSGELIGPDTTLPVQDVVIAGGGIAGMATALALHRLGIKPLILEQSDHLRTEGSAIGIWSNGWRALEALGVADSLRDKFWKLSGFEFLKKNGSVIASLGFDEGSRDIELRGVERKALIESLKEPLPDGTAVYNSRVIGIKKLNGGRTEVHCENGLRIQTKVLIGCDGSGSVVAKWMNMGEVRFSGQTAVRGLAFYPDQHNLNAKAKQLLGEGVRAGVIPMDANTAYWFVVFNSTGEKLTDVELVREEALNHVRGWPSVITDAINRSPLDTFSRRALADRWMWPAAWTPFYKDGVTLAGDALHPVTPNLGQGGCCALEDAVILARALSKALSPTKDSVHDQNLEMPSQEKKQIEVALKSYTEQRWPRMLPIAIRSYVFGALLQIDSEIFCSFRNKLIPRILNADRFFNHTFYDCGTLEHWDDGISVSH